MKKIVIASFSLLLVLAGCGSSAANSSDDIVLSFAWWGGDERQVATLKAVDLYNETHEGVTIEPEYYSYDGMNEKFPIMMVGGTEPDIMQVNYAWVYQFAGENGDGFYNLNELSDELGLENWNQEDLDVFTINGNLQAIPQGFNTAYYGYNKDVLEEAGIETPSTWDEVFEYNEELRNIMGDDYYLLGGIGGPNNQWIMMTMVDYISQETGKEFIVDKKVNFTVEELTMGFDFVQKLFDENVIPPIDSDSRYYNSENPNFINGNYVGVMQWNSSILNYVANLPEGNDLVIGDFISNQDEKKVMVQPSMGFAISKSCEYPEEAAEFLNWMQTDPEALDILGAERGVPANTVAYSYLIDTGGITDNMMEMKDMMENTDTVQKSPYYEEPNVREAFLTVMDEFMYGELTSEEAAQRMIADVNTALDNIQY